MNGSETPPGDARAKDRMAQLFHPSFNTLSRLSIFGGAFGALGLILGFYGYNLSPYVTQQGVVKEQPVPFSHEHHVRGLGIDCRYCHTSVETSPFAGMPPTATCMNCHKQIWTNAALLAPVRTSFSTNTPLRWSRVHDLPDFVYFDHSIHVAKGIGCATCHGRVDRMPLLFQNASLQMEWCLECHRDPAKYIRPKDQVFNMAWEPPADQLEQGTRLVAEYNAHPRTSCSTCHR